MQVSEIYEQLLDPDELAWSLHTDAEGHLGLVHAEDLVELHQLQLLFRDVLAVLLGQVLAVACEQLPIGCYVFQCGQLGRGTPFYHVTCDEEVKGEDLNNKS